MLKKDVTVAMKNGGEVSVAALVVQKAGEYSSSIYFQNGQVRVNAKSIMGMMTMPFSNGNTFTITAEGDDEENAVTGIAAFLTE